MPETFPFDPPPPPRLNRPWSTWTVIAAVLLLIGMLAFSIVTG